VKENESSAEGGKSAKMAEQHEGKRQGKGLIMSPEKKLGIGFIGFGRVAQAYLAAGRQSGREKRPVFLSP